MALVACPECSHQVSDLAPTCPSCGFPLGVTTKDGKIALRNCPECHGTGVFVEPCFYCDNGKVSCGYCNRGYVYDEPCKSCHATCMLTCDHCNGKGTESSDCQSCDHSGQVTLKDYAEIIAARESRDAREEEAQKQKYEEVRQTEADKASVVLQGLSNKLFELRSELYGYPIAETTRILTDSAYAFPLATISKTYLENQEQLHSIRFQCIVCGQALDLKERMRRLKVHDRKECRDSHARILALSKENRIAYEALAAEHSELNEDGA